MNTEWKEASNHDISHLGAFVEGGPQQASHAKRLGTTVQGEDHSLAAPLPITTYSGLHIAALAPFLCKCPES